MTRNDRRTSARRFASPKFVREGNRAYTSFFTGKPQVDGLGHAFLVRNYRAGLAKWQTADPMGYQDGWNQLAYCGNKAYSCVDIYGAWATGVAYSIDDPDVPLNVRSTRTHERDIWWAEGSDNFFNWGNEPLSQALVEYAQTQTGATATDYAVDSKYFSQIEADAGFGKVRDRVAEMMRGTSPGGTVSFNKEPVVTTLVSRDLNHSIHGVTFYLDGSITVDASGHWEGILTVSFSDPYDFNASDPDWRVRIWGRLYDHGWISKFNATGSWTVNFKE